MTSMPPRRPFGKKKVLIAAGALVALLVVLAIVAAVVIDPAALIAKKKDELLRDVSAQIGRQVTAGEVTTSVGTKLSARIVHLQVAGPDGQKPQLEVGAVDMRLSLLRAILTFGQDLHVERFVVQGLVARAARDAEGRWNFQDILDNTASDPAAPEEEKKDKGGVLEDLRIASVQIIDGRVELDDKTLGRPLAVSDIDIDVSDVELGKPLAVTLAAVLEDGARKSPISMSSSLAVLPKNLSFDPLPDLTLAARWMDVDLGPWGGLLPGDVPGPVQGTLRTDLTLSAQDDAQRLKIDGTLYARGLVLRDAVSPVASITEKNAAPRGAPLDADVTVAANIDQRASRYVVDKLTIVGNGLDVNATLDATGTSLAALQKADVKATAADLNRVLAVLPPGLAPLPEALRIDGPLSASLNATGAEIDGRVNLDGARVRYLDIPEEGGAAAAKGALFDKPTGKALNLAVHGKKGPQALDIDQLALMLDTTKIGGTLSIPTAEGAPLVADINSGSIALVSLRDLVPPFQEALQSGRRVAGTAALRVQARDEGGKQQADAGLNLSGLDVNLAATQVRGEGGLTLQAAPQSAGTVDIELSADFDGLGIQQTGEDGALVVNKPVGQALRLEVQAQKAETRADIPRVALAIGNSTIQGKGTVTDLDQEQPKLAVDFGNVAVAFDDLRAAVPGAASLPAGGRLTAAVKLGGGISAETLVVDVKGLNVGFGSSRIAGDVNVENLSEPVLDVKLPTIDLAFDELRGLSAGAADLPPGGRFAGDLTLSGDTQKPETVKATVTIAKLTAPGSAMSGNIAIANLDRPTFDLTLNADSLDVDRLLGTSDDKEEDKTRKEKQPKTKRENPHGLSKDTRELLAGVNGKGVITAKRAIIKEIPMQDFKGVLVMRNGVAHFDTLELKLYGGTMSANGTVLNLPAERLGYDLNLQGKNIDLGAAVADQTRFGKIFTGQVSPDIDIKGRGLAPRDFAVTAQGPAELVFESLAIQSLDLLGPITDAVEKSGKLPRALRFTKPGDTGTLLDGFKALTIFQGGKMKLQKAVETKSSIGQIVWTGAVGLDGALDLSADLALAPATVSRMTANKVKPKESIPVPLKVTGTWDKPRISGIDVGRLLTALVQAVGGEKIEEVKEKGKELAKEAAKDVLSDVSQKTDKKKQDARKAADKVKKKAADKAKDAVKGIFGN